MGVLGRLGSILRCLGEFRAVWEASWGRLGGVLEPSWGSLGASWAVLWRHVGVLGASSRYLVPDFQAKVA